MTLAQTTLNQWEGFKNRISKVVEKQDKLSEASDLYAIMVSHPLYYTAFISSLFGEEGITFSDVKHNHQSLIKLLRFKRITTEINEELNRLEIRLDGATEIAENQRKMLKFLKETPEAEEILLKLQENDLSEITFVKHSGFIIDRQRGTLESNKEINKLINDDNFKKALSEEPCFKLIEFISELKKGFYLSKIKPSLLAVVDYLKINEEILAGMSEEESLSHVLKPEELGEKITELKEILKNCNLSEIIRIIRSGESEASDNQNQTPLTPEEAERLWTKEKEELRKIQFFRNRESLSRLTFSEEESELIKNTIPIAAENQTEDPWITN